MVLGALRSYLQLANGLTDVTRQRAVTAARQLLDQGGDVVDQAMAQTIGGGVGRQVQSLAEDLIATSKTNRDLLVGLIRTEVDRTVARMGLVGADELAAVAKVVGRLQSQLDAAIAFGGNPEPARAATIPAERPAATKVPAKKVPAKVPVRTGVPVKKAAAAKVPVKRAVPVKKAAAAKVPVKRAVPVKKAGAVKVAPAKKVPAVKKVPAKKLNGSAP